jgi:hypothetical protein
VQAGPERRGWRACHVLSICRAKAAGHKCIVAQADPSRAGFATRLLALPSAGLGRPRPGESRSQHALNAHVVRSRVTDPRTSKKIEVWKVLPELNAAQALQWLDEERDRVRRGESRAAPSQTRFANYAVSLLERKLRARDIKSEAGIRKWKICLQRLFRSHLAELFIEKMRPQDFTQWRDDCAGLIAEGRYSPVTMNTDLSVPRVIMTSAKVELGLSANPAETLAAFDTSQHPSYTFEEPNSLTVEELRKFLGCMRENFPGHYAMTFLGFALGKRPSTTRPLRRRGSTPDVHWDTGVLLFRRSNTHGQVVMEGVKTRGEERVQAPAELLAVLRWHVETQLRAPGAAGLRLAVSGASRRLPNAQRARQALPGGGAGNRPSQTHYPSGHATHLPGPLPRGRSERPRHSLNQWARDGSDAAPLQHRRTGRAAARPRQRHSAHAPGARPLPRW